MRWKAAILGVAFVAAPALASGQTTTDCYRTATGMTCRTAPSSQLDWGILTRIPPVSTGAIEAYRAGIQDRQQRPAFNQEAADRESARQAREFADYIGQQEQIWRSALDRAVAEGRCGEARAMLQGAGRLEMLDQVAGRCVTPAQ